MAPPQPALRSVEPHIHPFTETCPTCEQPIRNDKAKEIRARATEMQKRLADAADARAAQEIETEKARFEREKDEALQQASVDAAAQVEAAKVEGRKSAEAGFEVRIAASEKAKTDAEAAAAQKVAAAEQAANTQKEEAQRANAEKAEALAKAQRVEAERDEVVNARVREVREALEKDKAEALATAKAADDAKMQKLSTELDTLKRQVEKQRADELGEGAHIQLLEALKAEFPGDDIRRIRPGVSGADILHTIMRNGVACGSILYESKNSTQWRDDYVTKLIRDQTAARADHAILATFKFPKDTAQVAIRVRGAKPWASYGKLPSYRDIVQPKPRVSASSDGTSASCCTCVPEVLPLLPIRDGVSIVNPARAVVIAHMVRKQLLHIHTLRLSKAERMEKMAALYDFMTSERCALLLSRIDSDAEALLDLQVSEKTFHDNHWKKQGLRYKSIQKAKSDLDIEVGAIIGGVESVG